MIRQAKVLLARDELLCQCRLQGGDDADHESQEGRMSAYFVDKETIDRCVVAWVWRRLVIADQAILDGIGKALWVMNAAAMVQRYPIIRNTQEYAEYLQQADSYVFALPHNAMDVVQCATSLDCYLYQCSEGNIPEGHLYKLISELRDSIRAVIGETRKDWE